MKKLIFLPAYFSLCICTFCQNLGINHSTPQYPISLPPVLGDKVSLWGDAGPHYGFGIQPYLMQIHTDGSAADIAFGYGSSQSFSEIMRIKGNGNIGIGTNSPNAPLGFPALLGKKITLYPGTVGDAGLAVWGNELRIASDYSGADITFGTDDRANGFTERMRIKGNGNVAIGTNNPYSKLHVYGSGSFGEARALGSLSIAVGGPNTRANGNYSIAVGSEAIATANQSAAFGYGSNAVGESSLASGYFARSEGYTSTAIGRHTLASGSNSIALGAYSTAKAYGSCSIGTGNDNTDTPNPTTPGQQDRVFQIGNASGDYPRSNAMTVLRNGNVGIGTMTPSVAMHVKTSSRNPAILDGGTGMWVTIAEEGINRGYIGSFAGNLEDVDFGTYNGSAGAVHLTTNNLPRLTVISNGNVGIGTTSPSQKLHVAGNVFATGGFSSSSDIRYKRDLSPISHSLSSILSLQGLYYYWKKNEFMGMQFDDNRQIGFAAQEVEKLFPELVMTDANGYKSVDYGRLTPVLAEAIKEQQQQINKQQQQIDELKKLVEKLISK